MPFEVIYGRALLTLVSYTTGVAKVVAIDQQLRDRNTFVAEVYECLLLAQQTMKAHKTSSGVGVLSWRLGLALPASAHNRRHHFSFLLQAGPSLLRAIPDHGEVGRRRVLPPTSPEGSHP
jgi:hypothetical protein